MKQKKTKKYENRKNEKPGSIVSIFTFLESLLVFFYVLHAESQLCFTAKHTYAFHFSGSTSVLFTFQGSTVVESINVLRLCFSFSGSTTASFPHEKNKKGKKEFHENLGKTRHNQKPKKNIKTQKHVQKNRKTCFPPHVPPGGTGARHAVPQMNSSAR